VASFRWRSNTRENLGFDAGCRLALNRQCRHHECVAGDWLDGVVGSFCLGRLKLPDAANLLPSVKGITYFHGLSKRDLMKERHARQATCILYFFVLGAEIGTSIVLTND
jgi:hypothetical protein